VNFDNRVSWMDLVALTGAGIALFNAYYGVGQQVTQNANDIARNYDAIVRIEEQAIEGDQRVSADLQELKVTVDSIREESAEGRLRIENKIDKLIDRELNK